MKLQGEWESDQCPCCKEVERAPHVVLCPDQNRDNIWEEAVNGLMEWFDTVDTDARIGQCICDALRLQSEDARFTFFADVGIRDVAEEQDGIGWMNFVEGRMSKRWTELQRIYYMATNSRRTAKTWTNGLIQQLYSMVHKMWIARNQVVHERDENGRLIKEQNETEAAIEAQFELEYDNLRPQDWHYIDIGLERVMEKLATEQRAWLYYIKIARQVGTYEIETTETQQRDMMASWLERGR